MNTTKRPEWHGSSSKKCSQCPAPSVKGLKRGHAYCRYHYAAYQYGTPWADKIYPEYKKEEAKI